MKTFFLAAAAALATAATAQAAPQPFFFDCNETAPLQSVYVDDYTWSAEAPTASYQDGAGCGWLDPGFPFTGANQPNPLYDAGFGGDYAGEVRKLEFTLYAPTAPVTTKTIDVAVVVDGSTVGTVTARKPVVGEGPDAAISSYTYSLFPLDIPATTRAKKIVLAVQLTNPDDTPGWLLGTKEVPSGAKLFAYDDLTPAEQEALAPDEEEEEL
jgi:hypothetical protein